MTDFCPTCRRPYVAPRIGGLTRQQQALLDFIVLRVRETRISPFFEEMTAALGLKSRSSAARLVDALEERGRIRRLPGRARGIEIVGQGA